MSAWNFERSRPFLAFLQTRTMTLLARVRSISGGRARSTACSTACVPLLLLFYLPILVCVLFLQQDIPFYIRIPESIPPTLTLENGGTSYHPTLSRSPDRWHSLAGIKYELVGQVCIRSKSYVLSVEPIGTHTLSVDSSDATSRSFFLPLPQSSSTSTNFTPLGQSSSNMNHAISPRMP